jgi:hypothetical protein
MPKQRNLPKLGPLAKQGRKAVKNVLRTTVPDVAAQKAVLDWFNSHPNKAAVAYKTLRHGAEKDIQNYPKGAARAYYNAIKTGQRAPTPQPTEGGPSGQAPDAAYATGVSGATGKFVTERSQSRLASGEAETHRTRRKKKITTPGHAGGKGSKGGPKKLAAARGKEGARKQYGVKPGTHISKGGEIIANAGKQKVNRKSKVRGRNEGRRTP